MADEGVSEDRLLGGRVSLRQPRSGFRAAIDAVLLAAAVPARDGEVVLDIGSGSGAASLCLAARVIGVRVSGLEADAELVELAAANAVASGLAGRVTMIAGNLRAPPPALRPGTFDHVMANPPHLASGHARASPDPRRAAAMIESSTSLADWLAAAAAMVRSRGTVTLVHRADRLDAVLSAMAGGWGDIRIYPLWPGAAGRPAQRIIVDARKGARGPLTLLPGLVLHEADGRYTEAAEAILRDGAALTLAPPA